MLNIFNKKQNIFPLVFQVPIIPVVFSSYSNFYLRKEKQFKSGNCPFFSFSSNNCPFFLWNVTNPHVYANGCLMLFETFDSGVLCLHRNHQIEDTSKDWDKGDVIGWCVIPLWKILQRDALCLPGHVWLRNPEQRALEALNIYHTRTCLSPMPLSETHSSTRPPRCHQVVLLPGQETTWRISLVMKSLLV